MRAAKPYLTRCQMCGGKIEGVSEYVGQRCGDCSVNDIDSPAEAVALAEERADVAEHRMQDAIENVLGDTIRMIHQHTCTSPLRCLGPDLEDRNLAEAIIETVVREIKAVYPEVKS